MTPQTILHFGSTSLGSSKFAHRQNVATVVNSAGAIGALLIDARGAEDFVRGLELLRTLYDDPSHPRRLLHPGRVLGLITPGDVDAAFAFGRYGIAGVIEDHDPGALERRLQRILASNHECSRLTTPALAPPRSTRLGPRPDGKLPTVAIGHRHAPQTASGLARYVRVLREHSSDSSVFADVATLIDVMVAEDLTCQTNLASKAGATHSGQFIGSFEFYRELRRSRYGQILNHPEGDPDMEVFIAIDEVVHEVLHLLFLANAHRAGHGSNDALLAEEMSVTWWQAVIHNRVFPAWIKDRHILEINDDFLLSEANQDTRGFWKSGTVFAQYADYPWIPYVLGQLPARTSYIGQRPDLAALFASFANRPEAQFLVSGGMDRLCLSVPFSHYPAIPSTLSIAREEAEAGSSQGH